MKLEEYRVERGLSYDELSSFLGISRPTTYNICTKEENYNISLKNAHKIISKTFGLVGYQDLMIGE